MEGNQPKNLLFQIPLSPEEIISVKRFLLWRGTSMTGLFIRITKMIAAGDPRITKLIDEELEAMRIERTQPPQELPLIHVSKKAIYDALSQNDPLKERTPSP